MKMTVKALALITSISLLPIIANSQLKLPTVNGVGNDVKKIIEDYPNHFLNMTGDLIVENTQSTEYECTYKVNGQESATITRYSSKANNIYSWEALMLTTESFDKAKQKFKSLYSQLNNLSVHAGNGRGYQLKGDYEAPEGEKKFTNVIFSLGTGDENLKKLKAEVSMQYELTEWKVKLLVYGREKEDAERGKEVEDK